MKIGIVCYPTYGGSGVVATELGLGLANKGHQIHFITYRRPPRLNTFNANVYFHEVGKMEYPLFEYTPYETALASKMVDVVKYEKLDILHVHYAIPHAAVAYMAKKILADEGINIPIVTTLHGTDITLVGTDRTYSPVVEFSINHSDGVTAVSKHLAEMTYTSFNIKNEIKVIYNFIDFARFKKVNKDHFRKAIAPDGEKILVHTSNFRKVKRVEDIVRVFHKVTKEVNAKLLLIGDGPERNNLEDLCRELKLCDHIRFLGKQDAIEELLSISDLFLLPSEQESFGLSALEAMACEVPVISSNAGGIPEVNVDGYTGYLTNVGDIDLMASRIIELLKDEGKLNQFRQNALSHAQTFDIDKILPQYEEYYQETIDKVQAKALVTI
ncbi:MAG TPA: N-acetyl-alpha-D-glucosaminyl L-malate synthase BshA [Saprospiraceae bacterium]|nr:N-acetyl-alpha-D-glucosaminyl L-malate synthase BshA [Saprospiraceae bacterium]